MRTSQFYDLALVTADVERSMRTETPIYDGTAKTIAAGWQAPHTDMSAFSHCGIIEESLVLEIEKELHYAKTHPEHFDAHARVQDLGTARHVVSQLSALRDYVTRKGIRGEIDDWANMWVCPLSPEDEFNTDGE